MQAAQQQASVQSGPKIWILHSTGFGANRQLLKLAAALGGRVEVKNTLDSPAKALLDRLVRAGSGSIPAAKRERLCPPWPDLVLIGGGRSLVDALRIRKASGGKSRIVCIGRPGAPLDWVDLVLTTPQYGLPEHHNVLHLDLPLNFPDGDRLDQAREKWGHRFSHLPMPWIGVLLGGDSGSYRLTTNNARRLGRGLEQGARRTGGALLITTSPRTPGNVLETVLAELSIPHFCYRWQAGDSENPLDGILALADRFVVTADSASMLAEACSLGRPVASFEPDLRLSARLLARSWLPSWPRGLRTRWSAVKDRWIVAGRWIPARRMERIHQRLEARGLVGSIDALADQSPVPRAVADDLERAVLAVRKLLEVDRR